MINKKERLPSSVICCSSGLESANQRKRNERQILGPCQRTKKNGEHKDDDDNSYNWCTCYGPKRLGRKIGRSGN